MKESISKQYSNYDDFAKMLICFNDVVKNGIGLEVHENRYNFDFNIKEVYVLIGAFQDEKNIYPVKMEVKEFRDTNFPSKLYLSITLDSIKKEELSISLHSRENELCSPENSSKIKISDLLRNVNKESKNLIKYIPDGYLSPEKLEAKRKALEKEKEYILQKQKNREIKIEQRQQRREERRAMRERKGESFEEKKEAPESRPMSLSERNLRALRERKENQEKNKQPPETKPLSLAEKNLMALREKKAREKDKGIEK